MPKKKNTNQNLIICGAPAKKVPKPPVSNDDSNKPSILKALEAVVAASRLGLLGPTAMAAVEAMPDLEVECCDGKVGQETPSSIPLLDTKEEGKEEGKKERKVNEEGNTDVAVTPLVKGIAGQSQPPPPLATPQPLASAVAADIRNYHRLRRLERRRRMEPSHTPLEEEGAPHPSKGTGSSSCTRKDIWICGDDVISLSVRRSQCSQEARRLGFSPSVARVTWRGVPTMMWDDLLPQLHQLYHQFSFPSIIVIHLGGNDLLVDSSHSLVTKMQNDLVILQKAFQDVVIIWSSLLPKDVWKPSEKSQVMESERNNVNCKMEEFCNENGMHYFSHPLLTHPLLIRQNRLFTDKSTLSKAGADVFRTELRQFLSTYLKYD